MTKKDRIRSLLESVPLFENLEPAYLDLMIGASAIKSYEKDKTIYKTPSSRGRLNVVESGSVLVVVGSGKDERAVARYVAGESFGELDLLGTDSSFLARAAEATVVCTFPSSKAKSEAVFTANPDLAAELAERLLRAISDRTRAANVIVSEKAPWLDGLKNQIMTDKLTGLLNMTYLREEAPIRLEGRNIAIIMVKPDNFKFVNDTFGHDAGDAALRMLAATVGSVAEHDVAVRYKGNVFCIIGDDDGADDRAQVLLEAVRDIDMTDIVKDDAFHLTATAVVGRTKPESEAMEAMCGDTLSRIMELRETGGNTYERIN